MDHQDISNNMKEFIKMREEMKQGKAIVPNRKRGPVEDLPKNAKRPYKELPAFKPRPGEKPRNFLHRVNAVTSSNLKEAQFEAKYNVDVVRTEQGEVKVKKRSEAEMLELSGKSVKKAKKDDNEDEDGENHNNNKDKASPVKGIKKRKERFDKKKLKREKKQKVREELAAEKQQMYQREDIKFGDICHAPPQIKVIPRRGEKHETVARPGKKASLLLHSVIDPLRQAVVNPKALKSKDLGMKLKTGKLNLKGKRKELPTRTREAIEEEQRSVVQQYRELKKQKQTQSVPI